MRTDPAPVNDHVPSSTTILDGEYVPLDEVEEDGMLVDDLASTSTVTSVKASTEPVTVPKYCTYYRAVFLTDKGTIHSTPHER